MRKIMLSMLIVGAIALGFMLKINIGLDYESMWLYIAAITFFAGFIVMVTHKEYELNQKELFTLKIFFGTTTLIVVIVILTKVILSQIFFSEKYLELVEAKDSNVFNFNMKAEDTRRRTSGMAISLSTQLLGKKVKIGNGELSPLSSQFEIDIESVSVQNVNGELVFILPIDYSGFFKWASIDYIPGYIKISATDPKSKAELVLGKKIKVSRNGYFANSIKRKAWVASGLKQTKSHFEIDDEGTPYYISAVISPKIGFNADNVDFILVTNAETGISDKVKLEDVNKKYPWIDRVWPEYIIEERIYYYGSLQNGWLKKVTTGVNVSVPTKYKGQELFLVKANGVLNWFTGMTSENANDSALISGIIVEANSNSAIPILHTFEMNMVFDEKSALMNIEGDLGADIKAWKAVLPQPYIVDDHFYWTASIINRNSEMNFIKTAYIDGSDKTKISFNTLKDYNPKVGGDSIDPDSKEAIMLEISETIQKLSDLNAKLKELI